MWSSEHSDGSDNRENDIADGHGNVEVDGNGGGGGIGGEMVLCFFWTLFLGISLAIKKLEFMTSNFQRFFHV